MSTTLAFTLAAMTSLAPSRDHEPLSKVVADRVDAEAPLFADDPDKRRTSALYVAVLFRESSFDNTAIGDGGNSHCAGQVYLPNGAKTREGWSGADLREDATKCLAVVSRMLRASITACRTYPSETRLSVYARGRCDSAEGQRLSRDRMALAARLVRDVVVPAPTSAWARDALRRWQIGEPARSFEFGMDPDDAPVAYDRA